MEDTYGKLTFFNFLFFHVIGNVESLDTTPKSKGIIIREKLLSFYDTFYSANVMNLVVLGKGISSFYYASISSLSLGETFRYVFSILRHYL